MKELVSVEILHATKTAESADNFGICELWGILELDVAEPGDQGDFESQLGTKDPITGG